MEHHEMHELHRKLDEILEGILILMSKQDDINAAVEALNAAVANLNDNPPVDTAPLVTATKAFNDALAAQSGPKPGTTPAVDANGNPLLDKNGVQIQVPAGKTLVVDANGQPVFDADGNPQFA